MTDSAQWANSAKRKKKEIAKQKHVYRYANISYGLFDQKSPVHQGAGFPNVE